MSEESYLMSSVSLSDLRSSRQKSGFRIFQALQLGQVSSRRESVYAAQPLASPLQSPYHSVTGNAPLTEVGEDNSCNTSNRLPCSPLSTGSKSPCTNITSPTCFFNGTSPTNRNNQRRSVTAIPSSARRRSINLTPLKLASSVSGPVMKPDGSVSSYDSSPSSCGTPSTLDHITPKMRRISIGCSTQTSPLRSPLSSALPNVPNSLVEFLDGMPWLDGAPLDIKTKVAQAAQVRPVHQGEVIIRKGEIAKAIFFVARGIVEVISEDSEVVYAELAEGSIFGEIGILFDRPRTCSCRAATNSLLLSVKKDSFLPILSELPELKERIMKEATERLKLLTNKTKSLNTTNAMGKDFTLSSVAEYLLSFPIFCCLDRQSISQISLLMEAASYKANEEILRSTSTPTYETVFFVLQGDVEISTYPNEDCETTIGVDIATAGMLFGDLACFFPNEPMPETQLFSRIIRASTACEMLKIPSDALRQYLSKNADVANRLHDEIETPTRFGSKRSSSSQLDDEESVIVA